MSPRANHRRRRTVGHESPNERSPLHARTALCLPIEDHWPGASESERSPTMRAERAKPMSRRDEMIVAQDKRSAVLGYGREIITSLFSRFGLAVERPAKPNLEKKGDWWLGGLYPGRQSLRSFAPGYYHPALSRAPETRRLGSPPTTFGSDGRIGSAGGFPLPPPTPPDMRVRVRRFLAVLTDKAALFLCHDDRCPVLGQSASSHREQDHRWSCSACQVQPFPSCEALRCLRSGSLLSVLRPLLTPAHRSGAIADRRSRRFRRARAAGLPE